MGTVPPIVFRLFHTRVKRNRLLQRGIVVHHGRMPRLLSRLLVEVVEQRIANVVLSTSTLAEGVNLPFEVLLVPSLRRGQFEVSPRNLKTSPEEPVDQVLQPKGGPWYYWPTQQGMGHLGKLAKGTSRPIESLGIGPDEPERGYGGSSPLAELMTQLRQQWEQLPGAANISFLEWLERTQPLVEGPDASPAGSLWMFGFHPVGADSGARANSGRHHPAR